MFRSSSPSYIDGSRLFVVPKSTEDRKSSKKKLLTNIAGQISTKGRKSSQKAKSLTLDADNLLYRLGCMACLVPGD